MNRPTHDHCRQHHYSHETKLGTIMGKILEDCGAAASAPLVVLGDKLGLYRAMADGVPLSAAELAARTGTAERYVREWLAAQAAGGYVTYGGPATTADGSRDRDRRYHLGPEQAVVLADDSAPTCMLGAFEIFTAAVKIGPRLLETFRTGDGAGWHEHGEARLREVAAAAGFTRFRRAAETPFNLGLEARP